MAEDLVAILSGAKHLPREALARAVSETEAVAEPVLRALDAAVADPDALSEADGNLLFWGLHALAGARDARVYAPLMRLLRADGDALDGLLGDAVTETLPRVIASVFDGDVAPLRALLLDSTADDFVRNGAFAALGFLVRQERIERDAARALLVRFDDARVAVEESPGWTGWEETIAYLALGDLAPRVEAARRDGRITDEVSDLGWFRKALRRASAEPPDLGAFAPFQYGYLDDPVGALAWTDKDAGQPIRNPFKDVGRNDPCPCGSGRKFKKCCLDAGPDAALMPVRLPGLH